MDLDGFDLFNDWQIAYYGLVIVVTLVTVIVVLVKQKWKPSNNQTTNSGPNRSNEKDDLTIPWEE
jgi:hypothetical protein